MDKLMKMKAELEERENKGFTLMEMLIVVAIIAVLVAIAIPVFTGQLEKAREATDAANIRSAYGVIQAAALTQEDATSIKKNDTKDTKYTVPNTAAGSRQYQAVVTLQQTQDGWQSGAQDIGGVAIAQSAATGKGTATILYDESTGKTTITMS
jgi:type IV pilus assembly protein PilA